MSGSDATGPAAANEMVRTTAPIEPQLEGDQAFWAIPIETVFADLASSLDGLTDAEAARRLQTSGPNVVALYVLTAELSKRLIFRKAHL